MVFNSLSYAVFFPVVFILYWAFPPKHRWILLLTASYYFYMSWNVKYVFLILLTTLVSYLTALFIAKTEDKRVRKALLTAAFVVCLGVLFCFKYFNFFSENLGRLFSALSIPLHPVTLKLLLPVGISFYTFQTLSYVVDVYRNEIEPERHFGIYALFISFFPQLVAGPIERASNLLPQIREEKQFDCDKAIHGLKLITWGLFKKIIIADRLAVFVDKIYNSPTEYTGFVLVTSMMLFTIQIYCDFSGYSDIAVGSAGLLGFDLMTNFKSPYFSASIREFWARWHISLSTWFRDYVYFPLGGSRVGKLRHKINLLITFVASGLWHGASWNYICWGGLYGLAQIVEPSIPTKPCRDGSLRHWLRVLATYLFQVFAMVFFRTSTLSEVGYVFTHIFDNISSPLSYLKCGFTDMGLYRPAFFFTMFNLLLLAVFDFFNRQGDVFDKIGKLRKPIRYALYFFLVAWVSIFRAQGEAAFIYFQF